MDSLEKLFHIDMKIEGHESLDQVSVSNSPIITDPIQPDVFFEGLVEHVTEAVESDREMKTFCKFYESRRFDELSRAGSDERRRHKVISDLSPKVYADVVAIRGLRYDVLRSAVSFVLDGEHRYDVELEVLPASGKVLSEPERAECAITGNLLPTSCLSKCSVTGKLATTHLLVQSPITGKPALPEAIPLGIAPN